MALPDKPRISDFPTPVAVHGDIKLPAQDPNITNLSEQNVGPTLNQIRAYIISGVPTSPGEWVTQPTISIVKNADATVTVKVSAGTANFPVGMVEYALKDFLNVPLPSTGLNREDAVYALENGTFGYAQGAAGTSTSQPPIPAGALLVNYLTLNNSGGTVVQPASQATLTNDSSVFAI